MVRILLAALTAFVISVVVGWFLIPALRALHAGQSIKEIGPNWHKNKEGTPTMGGIMFILAVIVVVIAFGWRDMAEGSWQAVFVLGFALVCGAIGFVDDFAKIRKHENTGLTAGWKFLLQLAAAIAFLALLRNSHHLSPNLYIPFISATVPLPWGVYLVFAAFVMVGCVNAVNLTDGLDGLAGSVTLAVSVFFAVLSHWWKFGAVGVFAGALAGGLLGFLVYNFHPAKVFMGDTGSLFLGGAVCGMAFALDVPLVLVPVGVIYIAETMSDIIQVGYFKLTHGKRIFRMAPLHHHLELGGWSEVRIVLTFTGITVAFCLLAFVGVMYRYAI
ncbi:MAG: phospho-N-acetylmuramoyl-pentapeptide-transferase [Oscillospiraceae bacterium]|nr:phospho-N-acetylmuramoyl-pentapeptide-transferase [Oscillospiraceae bacterium]